MKLQDCALSIDVVKTANPEIDQPENDWANAYSHKLIPESLYKFYVEADYFSFSKAPPFLKDDKNVLFSYLGSMTNGIRQNLVDTSEYVEEIGSWAHKGYDPIKKMLGKEWDPKAPEIIRKDFKWLIIDLYSCLDLFSEIVALLLPKMSQGNTVGKSQFSGVFEYIKKDITYSKPPTVVTPMEHYQEEFHKIMKKLFICSRGDAEWYEYFRLLRHKITHLGTSIFYKIALHDVPKDRNKAKFYEFLPNHWPYLPQEHMKYSGDINDMEEEEIEDFFKESLIHQDLVSFCSDLREKIFLVLEEGFKLLIQVYKSSKETGLRVACLKELKDNSKKFSFRQFK